MGSDSHPTVKPSNLESQEETEKWTATLWAGGYSCQSAIDVPGPKRVQALNQVWKRIPDWLDEQGIDIHPKEVDVDLKRRP